MLIQIRNALNSTVEIHWMDPEFLTGEMNLEPFLEVPFWIPLETDPEPGFYQISNAKALENGLEITDFASTVRVSYESFVENRHIVEEDFVGVFGIEDSRENAIIEQWKERM